MSLAEDRRRLTQDRKALSELRRRLFAQGLGLLADSSDTTSQEAGSETLPSVRASSESVKHAVSPDAMQKTPPMASPSSVHWTPPMASPSSVQVEEEEADEDASTLIRRRLFAQHPSHNPLDTTASSLSDGLADWYMDTAASMDCERNLRETLCPTVDDETGNCVLDDSMESTIGPCSPDERAPCSTRPSGSGCSPSLLYRGEPPSAEWTSGNTSSLLADDCDATGQFSKMSPTTEPTIDPVCATSDSQRDIRADFDAATCGNSPRTGECSKQCEIYIEDVDLIKDFEKVNDSLRRHGFGSVAHKLETSTPAPYSVEPRSRLVADARGLWVLCSDVLAAYEERGKRLRDALLAERSEDRRSRDTRVKELLHDNKRLENELRRLREVPQMPSTASPQSTRSPLMEKELADLTLKVKAAEASARHREREMEQLRSRLDQAIVEDTRRQEREREALAKPLRRRGAARDDPLLVVAVAHQARAETLQAEVATLTKHSHTLSFQLDAAEEKCRKLQAQQQFQMPGHMSLAGTSDNQCRKEEEMARMREATAREIELRTRVEEQLQAQMVSHAHALQAMEHRLREAESRSAQFEVERREATQQPSAGELRWQGEALRLRDELAEARRAWRSADPRVLMRRDKEIRNLGLDPRALENGVRKGDLVSILLDVCLQLRVGDLSQILPKTCALAKLDVFYAGVQDVLLELGESACQDHEVGAGDGTPLLSILRKLAQELRSLRNDESARLAAAQNEAEMRAQGAHVAEEGFRALAAELRLPEGAMPSACLQRVTELRIREATLEGLAAQLRCKNPKDLPQQIESLLRLCDERLAAQRIVEALQKLLRTSGIDEVLPALREVLDIGALRRRAVARSGGGSSHNVPSGGREHHTSH